MDRNAEPADSFGGPQDRGWGSDGNLGSRPITLPSCPMVGLTIESSRRRSLIRKLHLVK